MQHHKGSRDYIGTRVPGNIAATARWTAEATRTDPDNSQSGLTVTDQVVLGLCNLYGLVAPDDVRRKLARVVDHLEGIGREQETAPALLEGLDVAS